MDLLESIYWKEMDWLVWICGIGFARDHLPEEINWAGLAGEDLLERIYQNGFVGVDPQKWIGWCGFASEDSLGMNNGSGFPSVDLLERIYRDGFAVVDP